MGALEFESWDTDPPLSSPAPRWPTADHNSRLAKRPFPQVLPAEQELHPAAHTRLHLLIGPFTTLSSHYTKEYTRNAHQGLLNGAVAEDRRSTFRRDLAGSTTRPT